MPDYTYVDEPWRDAEYSDPYRYGHDPFLLHCQKTGDQSTEFSWGPGPVAPHLNGLPPSEGGQYMPKCPRVNPPRNAEHVGLPRIRRRPGGEVRGYPGDQVAR